MSAKHDPTKGRTADGSGTPTNHPTPSTVVLVPKARPVTLLGPMTVGVHPVIGPPGEERVIVAIGESKSCQCLPVDVKVPDANSVGPCIDHEPLVVIKPVKSPRSQFFLSIVIEFSLTVTGKVRGTKSIIRGSNVTLSLKSRPPNFTFFVADAPAVVGEDPWNCTQLIDVSNAPRLSDQRMFSFTARSFCSETLFGHHSFASTFQSSNLSIQPVSP